MSAVDMLACPFCGRAENLIVEHLEGTIIRPAYRVTCDYCGAGMNHSDRGDHIEEWNCRAPVSADIGNPISGLLICDGCGCTTTDAELAAQREARPGLISCCPERKMRPATREDWDKMLASKDAPPVSAGKVKALTGVQTWAACWSCEDASTEEPLHLTTDLRWDGKGWCCEECFGIPEDGKVTPEGGEWETAPRFPALQPGDGWQGKADAMAAAIEAEADARAVYLATMPDRGGQNGPKGQRRAALEAAQTAAVMAARAYRAPPASLPQGGEA